MGISRNNGEGYPDPTAHIAVRNVEADAKKLKINYPTGYIELNLERFFPCPQAKAKKVFRLIHRYCSHADKTRLLEFMTRRVAYYDSREANSMKKAASVEHAYEYKYHIAQAKEADRQREMLQRNIDNFKEGLE